MAAVRTAAADALVAMLRRSWSTERSTQPTARKVRDALDAAVASVLRPNESSGSSAVAETLSALPGRLRRSVAGLELAA